MGLARTRDRALVLGLGDNLPGRASACLTGEVARGVVEPLTYPGDREDAAFRFADVFALLLTFAFRRGACTAGSGVSLVGKRFTGDGGRILVGEDGRLKLAFVLPGTTT